MELFDFLQQGLGLKAHFEAAMLGMPRLGMFLGIAPFLGGASLLTGQLRLTVLLALYAFLHPVMLTQVANAPHGFFGLGYFAMTLILLKETLLGFCLAYVSSMIFWAVQGAGFVMDNQRGLSQSEVSDPLSGESTSPLGAFLFQSLVYLFFASGVFLVFLSLLYQTYLFWPPLQFTPGFGGATLPLFMGKTVAALMAKVLLLASVVLIAALLVDFALGLINRFASQLNVYILAMPIKSGLAMVIVFIMFNGFVGDGARLFDDMTKDLLSFRFILPGTP